MVTLYAQRRHGDNRAVPVGRFRDACHAMGFLAKNTERATLREFEAAGVDVDDPMAWGRTRDGGWMWLA